MLWIAVQNIAAVPVVVIFQAFQLNDYNPKYANAVCIRDSITALYVQLTAKTLCIFTIFELINLDVWHHSQGHIPTEKILVEPL